MPKALAHKWLADRGAGLDLCMAMRARLHRPVASSTGLSGINRDTGDFFGAHSKPRNCFPCAAKEFLICTRAKQQSSMQRTAIHDF
mmetsp:Transcript_37752/g.120357  ORF Transcript_37752/g.120357 Transcript_37752/m.120357 type:complete len:86 (+) Transcript_37752:2276-2533(+)